MEKTNRLIEEFLSKKEHKELYVLYRGNPTEINKNKLNKAFISFYKIIRAISYLNKVIHFEAKKMDREIRKHNERYQLVLDKPLNDEENRTTVDIIEDETSEKAFQELNSPYLRDYFRDSKVVISIDELTEKQKNILYLSFVKGLTDTEISSFFAVSQQSISKTKNKALGNLRNKLERGDLSA